MKTKRSFLVTIGLLLAASIFIGCASTPSVSVEYTEPAKLNMSGINRIAIDSNDSGVSTFISQKLSAASYIVDPTGLQAWQQWKLERQATEQRANYQAAATEISATDLASAYQANVARADSSYKDNTLKITGAVKELGQSSKGRYYMRLTAGSDSVDIYFLPSEMELFKSVDKGQTVTVFGKCSGRNLPDMEDTAEILRLLGAGTSVNIIDATFPRDVELKDYPGPLDAIVVLQKDRSVADTTSTVKRAAKDADGNTLTDADGNTIMIDVPVYHRKVTVKIDFQLVRPSDSSIIGSGTQSATSPDSSSEDQSQLRTPDYLESGIIDKPLTEIAAAMVSTKRTLSITLLKEESKDKEVKKQMTAAEKLVKAKDYKGAIEAYGKIYTQYNSFAAGYNQAILTEATAGTEAAIELMDALAKKTGSSAAQSALRGMQSRDASTKQAAENDAAK